MEIKQLLLKQMGMLSSVLGLVLGVITIIPFICNFSFFALIVLSAPIILVYMKKLDMIGILDIRQGAMYGAIIGFISFVAFSVSFCAAGNYYRVYLQRFLLPWCEPVV